MLGEILAAFLDAERLCKKPHLTEGDKETLLNSRQELRTLIKTESADSLLRTSIRKLVTDIETTTDYDPVMRIRSGSFAASDISSIMLNSANSDIIELSSDQSEITTAAKPNDKFRSSSSKLVDAERERELKIVKIVRQKMVSETNELISIL